MRPSFRPARLVRVSELERYLSGLSVAAGVEASAPPFLSERSVWCGSAAQQRFASEDRTDRTTTAEAVRVFLEALPASDPEVIEAAVRRAAGDEAPGLHHWVQAAADILASLNGATHARLGKLYRQIPSSRRESVFWWQGSKAARLMLVQVLGKVGPEDLQRFLTAAKPAPVVDQLRIRPAEPLLISASYFPGTDFQEMGRGSAHRHV